METLQSIKELVVKANKPCGYHVMRKSRRKGEVTTGKMNNHKARWDKLRNDYITAYSAWREYQVAIAVKYGDEKYASRTEKKRYDQLHNRVGKIGDKIFALLDIISPRNWHSGVPAHWVYEHLSFDDAVRPLTENLSVVPPLSYGATQPMR